MAIAIGIDNVTRTFGTVKALERVGIKIGAGEFFTLLGSSGSGKSTLLKLIGGFDRPTTGRVLFDGQDVTDMPANRRPSNTVFQDLALFPHMTVGENVAYGLKVKGVAASERKKRVDSTLALVDLAGFAERNVNVLSGGQRQRVALARALVMEPGILLLDEPLTGLDERLRQQMRDEFGRLHQRTGSTFVLVTHNQDEALSLSDRMAIMHKGRIEQVGRPADFFANPANDFVARFVGMERVLKPERLERSGGDTVAIIAGERLVLPGARDVGEMGLLAVRPDRISLANGHAAPGSSLRATVAGRQFRGRFFDFYLELGDGQKLDAEIPVEFADAWPEPGNPVRLEFAGGALVPVPASGTAPNRDT
ncbi:ABC transporter ATP-binding protein [Aminobacter sp. P9b]|uniref:ABC-type Fe3+/spermidine/putrescine transport system ATPase subunit n=1 Tax=Aminobacter niigataensis TaxID=83265 RepID=A0ABR6L1I4_9HYPH|nr:ABC transporter ATP-binding protein [Aminobacter niigataensis]MBB4649920.1 ABC-type Fe3+/spermidine/putrescine transport system ATPase subunit [Aminobacter niigataensis]CAI2935290.1 Spermidine/putrescine import ATP-binding protein PotA [Aminobacter niigataensis]